ncbi:hypothetical protein [Halobacterium noricense]|uniref:hypothetical protein n=1 Tax=Halobacterium noricense TaxID=223182 RepID=UPI001E3E647B|nr:hypothetical protein [Halobacterium noricense]UHH25616.1 hypothetical protein LT974_01430 [Halobacterium noricense]
MSGHSRRRLLQVGGASIASVLAGCSSDSDDSDTDNPEQKNTTTNEETQKYTIPPVVELQGEGAPANGSVSIEAIFKPATTPGDPDLYFEDEVTFELFVYDTFPVGNGVTLTKVAEKTNVPSGISEIFDVSFSDIPKNEQIRFRLKATNNNTGDTEWQMDQRVVYYEEYGDLKTAVSKNSYSIIEGDGPVNRNRFQDVGDKYIVNFAGGREFPAPELAEEVPYSREAYKVDNDMYRSGGPTCLPFKGTRIEMPKSHVEMSEEFMDTGVSESYDAFTFSTPVPSGYDYYGRGVYDVLDNPIYQKMADAINGAHTSYGINNHYGKILEASLTIQSNPYDQKDRGVTNLPIHLPEAYWSNPNENCVGHSYQLCWLLYNMGYTCGIAFLDRTGRNANHIAVCMPIPESVMESDFPDEYPETFHNNSSATRYIDKISDIIDPAIQPDSLGEYPWVYIESTASTPIGGIPFGGVREARLRYAIEPENNVFGTDLGLENGR